MEIQINIQEIIGLVALVILFFMMLHHVRTMKKQDEDFIKRLEKK